MFRNTWFSLPATHQAVGSESPALDLVFFRATADPADNQFIGVWVWTGFEYFTDDHVAERNRYRVEAVDFKAGHGELVNQGLC